MAQSFAGRLIRPGLLAFVFAVAVAQVFTASLLAAPCTPSATTLCLNASRFRVEVQWKDSHGRTGPGQAVPITADTGDFWFFSPANVELVVKVLDARGVNGNYWVFYGALSNVEYDLVVTDTATNRVKTYSNPQDQFASVGDTKAFTGDAPAGARLSSRMDVEGFTPEPEALADLEASTQLPVHEADATPVPCDGLATDLGLNGCRFRLSVVWKDSHGRTGAGQPVPLTNDTGYFWFFSPANIELVIKVLDARGVNGNFWVFYGALSNVEYTLTVTDTLTGAVHTYSNPSGQFASVGDTKAFHPGYSVASHADASRAVSQDIPVEGGTVSATAADGTVFTLTVPEGALLSTEKITLTPVASVDRFPFGGGLDAAVQLGPEGLLLFETASLVITTPSAIPADEEVTFAWRGSGDEFGLYPPDPTAAAAISLSVSHFATYGVGRGSGADQVAQRDHPLANAGDQLAQDLQAPAAAQRKALRSAGTQTLKEAAGMRRPDTTSPDPQEQARETLEHYYVTELIPAKPSDCNARFEPYLSRLALFLSQVVLYTAGPDSTLTGAVRENFDAAYRLLADCYEQAYARCKSEQDPSQGLKMRRIYRILQHHGEDRVDPAKIPLCWTFELTFDSFIEEVKVPGATFAFRHQVRAVVPAISLPIDSQTPELSAELQYIVHDFTGTVGDPKCTLKTDGKSSAFTFHSITFDINAFESGTAPQGWLRVLYDPGKPDFSFTITCSGAPPVTITAPRWRSIFEALRGAPAGSDLIAAEDWQRQYSGGVYAVKTYPESGAPPLPGLITSENTRLTLRHTPE